MAPELFASIIGEVPFVDVLNTMLDDSLPLTPPEFPEWGNPIASSEDYQTIASYSPYDQVSAQIASPRGPVFVTVTGKREPYIPMPDEVEDSVREDLIQTRATELSRQRATEIATTLRSAPDFAAAATAQGLQASRSS